MRERARERERVCVCVVRERGGEERESEGERAEGEGWERVGAPSGLQGSSPSGLGSSVQRGGDSAALRWCFRAQLGGAEGFRRRLGRSLGAWGRQLPWKRCPCRSCNLTVAVLESGHFACTGNPSLFNMSTNKEGRIGWGPGLSAIGRQICAAVHGKRSALCPLPKN